MKTPVIIAAFNEESLIGQTLARLHPDLVEPIVSVNGSHDRTAEIARSFGATVLESPQQGKLPAIQRALHHIGERALGPVLYLDADTVPVFPAKWPAAMFTQPTERPIVSTGLVGYRGGKRRDDICNSVLLTAVKVKAAYQNRPQASGANMATHLKDFRVLKRLLDMPHFWLGEDQAVGRLVAREDGDFRQVLRPHSLVLAHSRYVPPVADLVRYGRTEVMRQKRDHYLLRAAPGSRPYSQRRKRSQV